MTKSYLMMGLAVVCLSSTNRAAGVAWDAETFAQAIELAQQSKRPLLAIFGQTDCGYCKRFEESVLSNPDLAGLLERVVLVKISSDDSGEGTSLASEYRVVDSPTIVLINADIEEVDRIVGFTDSSSFKLAVAQWLIGRETIADLKQRFEARPDDPEVLLKLGRKYLDRRQTKDGMALLQKIQTVDPENQAKYADNADYEIGSYLQHKAHQPQDALPHFQRVVRSYPDSDVLIQCFHQAVQSLGKLGRVDEIIAFYDETYATMASQGQSHRTVASALTRYGKNSDRYYPLAVKAALKSVEVDPVGISHFTVAYVNYHHRHHAEAAEAIKGALELEPTSGKYLTLQRQIQEALGK